MYLNLESYKYLWDRSAPGWALLKSPDLVGGYCVFNELSGTLLLIEDERLNLQECQRMKKEGCKAIDAMPKTEPLSVEPKS